MGVAQSSALGFAMMTAYGALVWWHSTLEIEGDICVAEIVCALPCQIYVFSRCAVVAGSAEILSSNSGIKKYTSSSADSCPTVLHPAALRNAPPQAYPIILNELSKGHTIGIVCVI